MSPTFKRAKPEKVGLSRHIVLSILLASCKGYLLDYDFNYTVVPFLMGMCGELQPGRGFCPTRGVTGKTVYKWHFEPLAIFS